MKKTIYSKFWMAFFALIASVAFTACGDDDEKRDEPDQPDVPVVTEKWTATYKISASFGEDIFKVADIYAHIVNPDGSSREELLSSPDFNLTLEAEGKPNKAGVKFYFVPNGLIDLDGVYKMQIDSSILCNSYLNGNAQSNKGYDLNSSMSIKGEKLEEYLKKKTISLALGVDEKGSVVSVDPADLGL